MTSQASFSPVFFAPPRNLSRLLLLLLVLLTSVFRRHFGVACPARGEQTKEALVNVLMANVFAKLSVA